MVRNLVGVSATAMRPFGWDDERISHFVHGHTPDGDRVRGDSAEERLSYLPLPTLEARGSSVALSKRHVGMVRRVLLTGPSQCAEWVRWTRVLAGEMLYADPRMEPEDRRSSDHGLPFRGPPSAESDFGGEPRAVLKLIDLPPRGLREDANVGPYVGRGRTWSTVTPVVLPGYDDNRAAKALGLLRKSFVQAGIPEEVVSGAEIRFRGVGFRPGQDLAKDYEAPGASSGPKYHVWVRFPLSVAGPLAVGKLRYRGLGLFALVEDADEFGDATGEAAGVEAAGVEAGGGRERNDPSVPGSE